MSGSERELDLVLAGATGFVGRLTAEHLARSAPAGLRVGLAGRSTERLTRLRAELPEPASDWPLIAVDVTEPAAARALAERARVVVTVIGPYLRYGLPLVQACAAAGTHYADLTGETLFAVRSIATAHEPAVESGARIVHSCGFDSVPSDLGVGLCAAAVEADGTGPLVDAVLHVRTARGGISGGTVDSLRQQQLEVQRAPEARRLSGDPRALVGDPSGSAYGSPRRSAPTVGRDRDTARWHAPFVMGGFNRQIVFRSNALADWAYGREFDYREVVDTGRGPLGALTAAGIAAGSAVLMGGMALAPARLLLDRLLPTPGTGPSERTLDGGRFRLEVDARTAGGACYRTAVGATLDPGYRGTAVMLGESGLALAAGEGSGRSGVLTPMVALGPALAERLRRQGFTVTTERLEVAIR